MRALMTALFVILALPATARDLALVIGNEDYTELEPVRRADNLTGLIDALERGGMEVIAGTNMTAPEMNALVDRWVLRLDDADRLLVVLYGRFVTSDRDRYLVGVDRQVTDMVTLGDSVLFTGALETILASLPRGRSILVLGDDGEDRPYGDYLTRGIGEIDSQPDFVVVAGQVRRVNAFVADVLADPSETYDVSDARARRIALFGLKEGPMSFLGDGQIGPEGPGGDRREAAAWAEAERVDTESAYLGYLEQFPFGPNAATARSRLDAFAQDPIRLAQAGEQRLNLSRDDRRLIQAQLTTLGYDTRGVDGIFGQGTRGAISAYQETKGLNRTGYLDAALVALIDSDAARAEAEQAANRAEQERADRAYWRETGRGQSVAGLRAYLQRFPEGLFADQARRRLQAATGPVGDPDREAFERARAADTVDAYRRYLLERPGGRFQDQARRRIAAIQGGGTGPSRDAIEAERALSLNSITRTLIEERLRVFGANPGRVDGVFDEQFRSALRAYQNARGLPPTGYMSQEAVVLLLADSIFR